MRIENGVWVILCDDRFCTGMCTRSMTYVMNTPTGAVIRVVSAGDETESMVFVPNVEAHGSDYGPRLVGGAS